LIKLFRNGLLVFAAATLALNAPTLAADDYPSRPVRIVVGYAAGGITDVVARFVGDYFTRATGGAIVIENIGGAGGNIAFGQLAKAAPDGYTIGLAAAGNIVVNQYLYKNMTFDPRKDLLAATPIASAPQLIVVNASSPIRTLKDLVAFGREKPGEINYGSAGVGTTPHLSGVLLEKLAGIRMTHVPYRGMAPAITDLVGGRLHMVAVGAQPVLPFIRDGSLRALAVTDAHRLPDLPDVPTAAEAGVPGYEVSSWYGLFLPRNTPQPIATKIEGVVRAMLDDPVESKKFAGVSFVPMKMSRAAFETLIDKESKEWADLIRGAGIAAE
jgi:tripartite-type tricarboxylate transporter receptor subunit TctC